MHSTTLATLIDGVIGLAIIAGGIVLLALGKIDQPTGIAVIGAGAAVAKGATSSALALKVPAPSQHVTAPPAVATPTPPGEG